VFTTFVSVSTTNMGHHSNAQFSAGLVSDAGMTLFIGGVRSL
jgi:hypothetical protein